LTSLIDRVGVSQTVFMGLGLEGLRIRVGHE